ncbi:MAG: aldehyde dehydrogenase [Planctomycetaceae bacterium]|nr:aldehyde dehydrogenase [Planctomycetaceae bacterium]
METRVAFKDDQQGVPHYNLYVDGQWVRSTSNETIEVENPATEETIALIPEANEEDVQRALSAAQRAQPEWARLPAVERGQLLLKLGQAIRAHSELLAESITREQGKLITLGRGEVEAAAKRIDYAASWCRQIEGDILPAENPEENIYIHQVPYGVTVGIAAWNFPIAVAARKLGPALVTGNTMVLKPSELTPIATLELANIIDQVGFPPGVVNVVTGHGKTTGDLLVRNPITRLVSLTGSVRAGREVLQAASDNITVLRLELGGKAPFVVMDDADIDKAVAAAMTSRFLNCGQVCTCNERMYIQSGVYDQVVQQLLERIRNMKIGDPFKEVDLGPKISRAEVEKIDQRVQSAVSAGAEVLTGGHPLRDGEFSRGHWFQPTLVSGVEQSMDLMREETFGPVLPVAKFDEFEDALQMANDTSYGLSAYLFSNDMRRIMRVVRDFNFGEIYVNRQLGEAVQGFHTGHGLSGMGGEDGKYGVEGFLQKRTVYLNYS